MTAWVLIVYLGTNAAMTVPGIESEQECQLLIGRLGKERPSVPSYAICLPYRAAYRF